jgi:hypothetical protein
VPGCASSTATCPLPGCTVNVAVASGWVVAGAVVAAASADESTMTDVVAGAGALVVLEHAAAATAKMARPMEER